MEFDFWFIHNYKTMGTTIFKQLPVAYRNKFYGRRMIAAPPEKLVELGITPGRLCAIDHLHINRLIALDMVPNAAALSANNAVMMIVRNPIDRFLSICNFEKVSPDDMIVRLKHKIGDDKFQHKHVKNAHGLKVLTIKMENKPLIVAFFKRFGIQIDLSKSVNVSPKLYTLTEEHKEFIREFYKEDFILYRNAA
jgi:hypothetical protein